MMYISIFVGTLELGRFSATNALPGTYSRTGSTFDVWGGTSSQKFQECSLSGDRKQPQSPSLKVFFSLHSGSNVRLVTLEMAIRVIILLSINEKKSRLKDFHMAMIEVS